MSETPKTYTVTVTNTFPGTPEEAVLQMVEYLTGNVSFQVTDEAGFVGEYDHLTAWAAVALTHDPLTILPPTTNDNDPDGISYWTVSGDLREIRDEDDASTNYAVASKVRERMGNTRPGVSLDPEYSCFFAYCETEGDALWVKQFALDAARGPVTVLDAPEGMSLEESVAWRDSTNVWLGRGN